MIDRLIIAVAGGAVTKLLIINYADVIIIAHRRNRTWVGLFVRNRV